MRKVWITVLAVCIACVLTACKKDIPGTTKVNDILKEESYMRVSLGEAYLQEEVRFDFAKDCAVVPKNAEWGLPKYRDGETAGVSYGEEGGAETYSTDREANPELYPESYLNAINALNLTVQDVRDSGYNVKVVKRKNLDLFEDELTLLSGMVVKDTYKLVGVNIKFDDNYRPVKKEFQFEKKDKTRLDDAEKDSVKCTQKFGYDIGEMKFNSAFDKVKKEIEAGLV